MYRPDFGSEFVDFVRSIDGIRERAEQLCRSLSPDEFATEPIYVTLQSDASERLLAIGNCGGWAESNFGVRLVGRPGYRGPGHGIVLCDLNYGASLDALMRSALQFPTWDEAAGLPDLFSRYAEQSLARMLGACLRHEFSHVLDYGKPAEGGALGEQEIEDRDRVSAECMSGAAKEGAQSRPWDWHGLTFVRYQLHIRHRTEAVGGDVRHSRGAYPEWEIGKYALSPIEDYAAALGDEPERMRHLPLRATLDSLEPPPEFIELFLQDVSRFEAKRDAAAVRPPAD